MCACVQIHLQIYPFVMKAPKVLNPRPNMNVRFNYPFQSTKISLDTDRTCSFEYSSMRTLISGAHGNQHSPELTTPTQWKDSALARFQNSPQNASA